MPKKKLEHKRFSSVEEVLNHLANGGKACFDFYDSQEYFCLDKKGRIVNDLGGEIDSYEITERDIDSGIYSWPRRMNYYRLAKECGL